MLVNGDAGPAAPVGAGHPPTRFPLVGSVAAGEPRLAEEHVEDWVDSPFRGDFVLRVTGDSMINAGILDHDLVVVRRQDTATRRRDRRRPDRGRGHGQAAAQARAAACGSSPRIRGLRAHRGRRGPPVGAESSA